MALGLALLADGALQPAFGAVKSALHALLHEQRGQTGDRHDRDQQPEDRGIDTACCL